MYEWSAVPAEPQIQPHDCLRFSLAFEHSALANQGKLGCLGGCSEF